MTAANEESTFFVTLEFLDENGNAITPTSIQWSLRNSAGVIVNGREDQAETAAQSVTITLKGDDLKYSEGAQRFLTVEAVYGAGALPLVDELKFEIKDLIGK